MYYDPISLYGTFRFDLAHEIAHIVMNVLDSNEVDCLIKEVIGSVKTQRTLPDLKKEHIADYLAYQWIDYQPSIFTKEERERLQITIAQMLCNEIQDTDTAKSRINVLFDLISSL